MVAFLLCFSMNEMKPIISLFQTMKIRVLDFHCLGLLFSLLFYEFLANSLAQNMQKIENSTLD